MALHHEGTGSVVFVHLRLYYGLNRYSILELTPTDRSKEATTLFEMIQENNHVFRFIFFDASFLRECFRVQIHHSFCKRSPIRIA